MYTYIHGLLIFKITKSTLADLDNQDKVECNHQSGKKCTKEIIYQSILQSPKQSKLTIKFMLICVKLIL